MIELKHLNFGFELTNIEHKTQKAFTKLFLFLNIERTRMCSSFANLTPYFWHQMIEHLTSSIVRPIISGMWQTFATKTLNCITK